MEKKKYSLKLEIYVFIESLKSCICFSKKKNGSEKIWSLKQKILFFLSLSSKTLSSFLVGMYPLQPRWFPPSSEGFLLPLPFFHLASSITSTPFQDIKALAKLFDFWSLNLGRQWRILLTAAFPGVAMSLRVEGNGHGWRLGWLQAFEGFSDPFLDLFLGWR